MKGSGPILLLLAAGGVAWYLYSQSTVQNVAAGSSTANAAAAAAAASIPVNLGGTGPAVAPPVDILPPPPEPSLSGLGCYDWQAFTS